MNQLHNLYIIWISIVWFDDLLMMRELNNIVIFPFCEKITWWNLCKQHIWWYSIGFTYPMRPPWRYCSSPLVMFQYDLDLAMCHGWRWIIEWFWIESLWRYFRSLYAVTTRTSHIILHLMSEILRTSFFNVMRSQTIVNIYSRVCVLVRFIVSLKRHNCNYPRPNVEKIICRLSIHVFCFGLLVALV